MLVIIGNFPEDDEELENLPLTPEHMRQLKRTDPGMILFLQYLIIFLTLTNILSHFADDDFKIQYEHHSPQYCHFDGQNLAHTLGKMLHKEASQKL